MVLIDTPAQTHDRSFSPVLEGLHTNELDCLQSGLAALADLRHGTGSHLALGAPLRFGAASGTGPPSLQVSLEQRLTEAAALLGLRPAQRWDGLDGAALRRLAADHAPLYVVADAHTMSWLPYFGRRHLEHSFLLTGAGRSCTVVDPYDDDTPWGPARPGAWRLTPAQFDAAVTSATAVELATERVPEPRPAEVRAANARELAAAVPEIEHYLARVRDSAGLPGALDRLVLDIWALGRARLLHVSWLESVTASGTQVEAARAQAQAWRTLASQAYVAGRRDAALPAAVVARFSELLRGDVTLANQLAGPPGPGAVPAPDTADAVDPVVRIAVVESLAAVFRLGETEIEAAATLRDLPRFTSFRLVDVIERVETRLGVELSPDDLAAGSLHDVASLCALFGGARLGVPQ